MASQPLDTQSYNDEQVVRIRKTQAELGQTMIKMQKLTQDLKLATPLMFFQGAIAMAALIGAGEALANLLT
jgi:hypothetical protein